MKKSIFKKLGGLFLGLAMGLGVAVGVTAGNKASEVKASITSTEASGLQALTSSNFDTKAEYVLKSSDGYFYNGVSGTSSNKWGGITKDNSQVARLKIAGSWADGFTIQNIEDETYLRATTGNMTWATTQAGTFKVGDSGDYKIIYNGTANGVKVNGTSGIRVYTNLTYNATTGKPVMIYKIPASGFTLSYDANKPTGATGNVSNMPTNPSDKATSFTVDSKVPTLTGYTFKGWGMQSSGIADANLIQAGGSTGTISQNTTLYAYWAINKYTVTDNITNGSLEETSSIEYGGELFVTIKPETGYKFPAQSDITVMMGSTDITSSVIYDDNEGSIYYENVTGNITITATCPPDAQGYGVTWDGCSNVTIDGPSNLYVGDEAKEYTITAASGYKLPEQADVAVTGATSAYNKTVYNEATLTLSNPTGEVTISLAGIALENYGIAFSGENYTHTGVTTVQEFGSATITLTAGAHYDLPADVTVDGATKESYTKSTGKLVISNPTGAVTITVAPVARERYGITVTGAGDSADFFTYSGATEIYATESATVTIAPDAKGTDDIYVIRASDISVSGATKGAYNTTTHALTISNPTGAVTITVTPVKKVLQSIAVTTQPTKTSYDSGDTLNTAGLVVTATYTSGTETVPLSELKFSQTKLAVVGTEGTAKSETIYVYYGGKAASFTVNVTPVKTGTSGWNLVSATSELANNDKIIIAAKDYNYAISTTQNSNNRGQASITKSSDGKTATLGDGVQEITLVKNSDNTYSFECGTSSYLYAASSSSNYMKTQSSIDGNAKWTISISSDTATITAQGSNTRNVMQYNSGSSLFSAYASASQKALCIYKYTEADPKTGVAIDASYPAGDYTAEETINVSNISATLVYNDGTSTSVTSGLSINPSTYVEGTHEYTVSYSTYSTVIQIANVKPAKQMIGIELNTDNVTKAFVVDSTFEHDGLVVYGVYDNGDKEEITAGYHVSSPDMSTAGTKTITVTYQDFEEQTYDIEVSDSAIMNIVQGAVIEGYVGETRTLEVELLNFSSTASWSLNPTSSEYYSLSDESQSSSGYSATVTLLKACEEIELEISEANSGAESVTVAITVYADELTGITASTSKSTYVDGQTFDVSTVSVTAHYSSPAHEDESIDIGDCAITAKDSRDQAFNLGNPFEIDTYTITVGYQGKTDSFTVTSSMPSGLKLVIATETPGAKTYTLIKNASNLAAGKKYIIVGIKDNAYYAMKEYAGGSDNNVKTTAIGKTPVSDVFSNVTATLCEYTLGGSADNWTFKSTSYYLYAAGGTGSNNWLKGTTDASETNAQWSISIASDGAATIKTADSTVARHTMRFNTNGKNDPLFSCYASGQTDVYLYEVATGQSTFTYEYADITQKVYEFLRDANKFGCDASGETFDNTTWTSLSTQFGSLLPADKELLQKAVVSGDGKTSDALYTNFMEKYEYIVNKYGESYDFMKKGISSGSRINPIMSFKDVEPTTWIIAVVGVAGLSAIGGYFFYRKRKEI